MRSKSLLILVLLALGVSARAGTELPSSCAVQVASVRARAEALAKSQGLEPESDETWSHAKAALDPRVALRAREIYAIRDQATREEDRVFSRTALDSESDAFRHYVGTVLLARQYGVKFALKVTDAHEGHSLSMSSLMDRYNNSVALADFESAPVQFQSATIEEIGRRALELLKARKLVILRELYPSPDLARCDYQSFVDWSDGFLSKANARIRENRRKNEELVEAWALGLTP